MLSERVLIKRINRKLARDGERVRKSRTDSELGLFFCVDVHRNVVTAKGIDLVEWGRETGVVQPWETGEEERA